MIVLILGHYTITTMTNPQKLLFLIFCSISLVTLAQPANDNPCSATALPVNGSCSFSAYTNAAATASPGVPAPGCASYSGGDVWFTIIVPASGGVTIDMNSGVMTDSGMAVYSGTCGSLTLIECDDDDSPNGLMSMIALAGQTPGATLWVRVWEYGNNNNGTFSICAYSTTPPAAPSNDNPCSSIALPVNGSCSFSTYTNANATASPGVPAPGCASYSGGDVWFTITVPASGNVAVDMNTGVITDAGMAIYSGTCGSLALIECDDDDSGNGLMSFISLTGQTPGATLWVRVWEFGNDNNGTFGICAYEPPPPPPPPVNDNCNNATSVPVTPQGSSCSSTAGYITGATASAQANDCFGTADDDVWYSFVATTTDVQIDLSGISGTVTDMYFSVYGGTCGTPGAALLCSDPNSGQVSGLTVGNTYFIRVYTYTSTGSQSVNFNICVGEIGPCGISSASEDYCPHPATLTQGAGSWTSTTYDYYTADTPANSGTLFCGSVENNSWYEFTALSTTEVFNFTSVTACTFGDGVQAQVFAVTYDGSGCCNNFTSMSNCWNPGVAQSGTVTATGLTIGNQYLLMVDGWGGDNCAFTVSGWTAVGIILPVELIEFNGISGDSQNMLYWKTASEQDNSHFVVQRSYDAENFENIGIIEGSGDSQQEIAYQHIDTEVRNGLVYYRLEQFDFNGNSQYSEVLTMNRESSKIGLQSIYPNPTKSEFIVEFNSKDIQGDIYVSLLSIDGKELRQKRQVDNKGITKMMFDISEFEKGVYLIKLHSNAGYSEIKKIIKE